MDRLGFFKDTKNRVLNPSTKIKNVKSITGEGLDTILAPMIEKLSKVPYGLDTILAYILRKLEEITPGSGGGDADSVCGYKIVVMARNSYNPDTAEEDTIYFLYDLDAGTIAIPPTDYQEYDPSGDGYTPVALSGWSFKTQPSACVNVGTYQFVIELTEPGTIWEDGTAGNKAYVVVITPFILAMGNSVTVQYTGDVIPASVICPTPAGVNCSYTIISGGQELRDIGTYVVRLSLDNPNYGFDTGATKDVIVNISSHAQGWVFGDGFPIVFGDGISPSQGWVFGGAFPLVFGN